MNLLPSGIYGPSHETVLRRQIRDCGGEHEPRLYQLFGGTRASFFQALRTRQAYSRADEWKCADSAIVVNCAHRGDRLLPDPYATEVRVLHTLGIVDNSWVAFVAPLKFCIEQYDASVAKYRENMPSLEMRKEYQRPILDCLRAVQPVLLQIIEQAQTCQRQGIDAMQAAGLPASCTLAVPVLGPCPWGVSIPEPQGKSLLQSIREQCCAWADINK